MSRGFRRIGAVGACAAAVVALTIPVSATPAHAEDLDFTLYSKEVPADGDEGGGGQPPGVGDAFSFADDLYRAKGGEKVGRDGVTCTVVRAGNPGDLQCVGTFVLAGEPGDGQLAGQTLMAFAASEQDPAAFDIAVTGGTGDFENARGWIRSTPDGDYSRLEFHISR